MAERSELKPSRGQAKYIRMVKAEERRTQVLLVPSYSPREHITDQERLQHIIQELDGDQVDPRRAAELRIQKIWLQDKMEHIKPAERMRRIDLLLNDLQSRDPEVHGWLLEELTPGLSRIAQIRRSIVPPSKNYRG